MASAAGEIHIGEPAEFILLDDPYYVRCVLECPDDYGPLTRLKESFRSLIEKFNKKKIEHPCVWCGKPAERFLFCPGDVHPQHWCRRCSPFWIDEEKEDLIFLSDYMSVLNYVHDYCGGSRYCYEAAIRDIAQAKGLPEAFNSKDLLLFFRE